MSCNVVDTVISVVRSVGEGDVSSPGGKISNQVVNAMTEQVASSNTTTKHAYVDRHLPSKIEHDWQAGRVSIEAKADVVDNALETQEIKAVSPSLSTTIDAIGELVARSASIADPSNLAGKQLKEDLALMERVSRSSGHGEAIPLHDVTKAPVCVGDVLHDYSG